MLISRTWQHRPVQHRFHWHATTSFVVSIHLVLIIDAHVLYVLWIDLTADNVFLLRWRWCPRTQSDLIRISGICSRSRWSLILHRPTAWITLAWANHSFTILNRLFLKLGVPWVVAETEDWDKPRYPSTCQRRSCICRGLCFEIRLHVGIWSCLYGAKLSCSRFFLVFRQQRTTQMRVLPHRLNRLCHFVRSTSLRRTTNSAEYIPAFLISQCRLTFVVWLRVSTHIPQACKRCFEYVCICILFHGTGQFYQ